MKPGEVVTIRVSPRDCMGVADVVKIVCPRIDGMSFSQAVSIALVALLETARTAEQIPRREGWDYAAVLAPFAFKRRTARKLEITKAFELTGAVPQLPGVPALGKNLPPLTPEQQRARTRMDELDLKRQYASDSWSPEDEEEWKRLISILYDPPAACGISA